MAMLGLRQQAANAHAAIVILVFPICRLEFVCIGFRREGTAICRASQYSKMGKRNEKAITHDKLGKHMAHLIRLYMMCIDILEKEEIITFREKEHDLLMDIRNGEYLDEKDHPISAFYDILNEYEKRMEYAKKNTSLPDFPDHKKIREFKVYVNEKIVKEEI